jgi:hypothetical protein
MRDLVAVIVFITGVGFTIIPAAIASFHVKLNPRAVTISFIIGICYVVGLALYASLQESPFTFFKENADLAILSIVISALTLLVLQLIYKYKSHANT